MAMCAWVDDEIAKSGFRWNGSPDTSPHSVPSELKFTLDANVTEGIREAIQSCDQLVSSFYVFPGLHLICQRNF